MNWLNEPTYQNDPAPSDYAVEVCCATCGQTHHVFPGTTFRCACNDPASSDYAVEVCCATCGQTHHVFPGNTFVCSCNGILKPSDAHESMAEIGNTPLQVSQGGTGYTSPLDPVYREQEHDVFLIYVIFIGIMFLVGLGVGWIGCLIHLSMRAAA